MSSNMFYKKIGTENRGFTLIELLVVIAIIGILSSVVLASLNSARMKARDARKQADLKAISTALQLFYDTYGRVPANYRPCCTAWENTDEYNQSMQELVDAGLLKAIPKSPGGPPYGYYDYGQGTTQGAILGTTLEAAPNSTTGIPPSCRPWPAGVNWCSQSSSKEYCVCVRY